MLSFFKTKEKKEAANLTNNQIVEMIHHDFDTAQELLLQEVTNFVKNENINLLNKMKDIGFYNSSSVGKAIEDNEIQNERKKTLRIINEFMQRFPQYKIIDYNTIESICKKYDLYFTEAKRYNGDIPLKNMNEIANFDNWFKSNFKKEEERNMKESFLIRDRIAHIDYGRNQRESWISELENATERMFHDIYYGMKSEHISYLPNHHREEYMICATKDKLDLRNTEIRGRSLITVYDDPIVLYPIPAQRNIYFVVSKWGIEGEDENLVNEKMN